MRARSLDHPYILIGNRTRTTPVMALMGIDVGVTMDCDVEGRPLVQGLGLDDVHELQGQYTGAELVDAYDAVVLLSQVVLLEHLAARPLIEVQQTIHHPAYDSDAG
jgi:hypothetical protein